MAKQMTAAMLEGWQKLKLRGRGLPEDRPALQATNSKVFRQEKKLEALILDIREESTRYASSKCQKRPWEVQDGETPWPLWRRVLGMATTSQKFEGLMGLIIICNVFFIIIETNQNALCFPDYADHMSDCPVRPETIWWIVLANQIFLAVYIVESCIGIITFRWEYFTNRWNNLDFFVVVSSILAELVDGFINVAYMRMFRIARLMRAFRIVLSVRELYMLLSGLMSSLKAMFFGMILLLGMLVVWSIILVEFVHPVSSRLEYDEGSRSSRAYSSVEHSTLTLFQQIVAGDSWGTPSIQIIEEAPGLAVILVAVVVSVSLGVMNLILAVIVESAAEAREKDTEEKNRQKQARLLEEKIKLLRLCAELDEDNSGSVSLPELMNAWDVAADFREVMNSLEITKPDLFTIFRLLDPDKTGDVDYKIFVDSLYNLSTCDPRMMVSLCKMEIENVRATLDTHVVPKLDDTAKTVNFQQQVLSTLTEQTVLLEGISENCKVFSGGKGAKDASYMADMAEVLLAEADAGGHKNAVDRKLTVMSTGSSELDLSIPKITSLGIRRQGSTNSHKSEHPSVQIHDLRQYLEELACTKAEIMRKAAEQEAMLLSHTEILMSAHQALENIPSGESEAIWEARIEGIGKQVGRLRNHVHLSLAPTLQALERYVDKEVSAMRGGDRILEAVAAELKIPPPSGTQRGTPAGLRSRGSPRPSLIKVPGVEAMPPPETGRPCFPAQTPPPTPGLRPPTSPTSPKLFGRDEPRPRDDGSRGDSKGTRTGGIRFFGTNGQGQ